MPSLEPCAGPLFLNLPVFLRDSNVVSATRIMAWRAVAKGPVWPVQCSAGSCKTCGRSSVQWFSRVWLEVVRCSQRKIQLKVLRRENHSVEELLHVRFGMVEKAANQFQPQRFTSIASHGVGSVFIEEQTIIGVSGEPSSICIHGAKQPTPLVNGGVSGNEHDFRTKFEHLSSVTGFAPLVGVAARFRTAIFIRRNQRIAVGRGGNRAGEKAASIGQYNAIVSEHLDLGKTFSRVGGLYVPFRHTPETGRKPSPIHNDLFRPCSRFGQN